MFINMAAVNWNRKQEVINIAKALGKGQSVYERIGELPKNHARYFIGFTTNRDRDKEADARNGVEATIVVHET